MLIKLKSSAIDSVHYDPVKSQLTVQHTDGTKHVYENIPPAIHNQFVAAKSAGSFFNKSIRGKYKFTQV